MTDKDLTHPNPTQSVIDLRAKALEIMKGKPNLINELDKKNIDTILHELQVYQTELEIQNEELRRGQLEIEESRNRFQALFNTSTVGFVILDENINILEINHTLLEILEATPEDFLNKSFLTAIDPEDQKIFIMLFRSFFKNPQNKTIQIRSIGLESKTCHLLLYGSKINFSYRRAEDPKSSDTPPLLISAIDITKSVEKELEIAKQKEEQQSLKRKYIQASKILSLGNLTDGVAHEINNSLQILSGDVTILEKSLPNEFQNKLVATTFNRLKENLSRIQTITKSLLICAPNVDEEDEEIAPAPPPTPTLKSGNWPKTAMILDDEEAICNYVVQVLDMWDIDATGTTQADQATKLLANGKFDLLIIDQRMPKENGIQMIEKILSLVNHPLEVILITGDIHFKPSKDAPYHLLKKPFTDDELKEKIMEAFQTS